MTLRFLVILLLLANALLWAGSHDALPGLGLAPTGVPAPGPVARQVRPEALAVRPLADVAMPVSSVSDEGAVASQPAPEALPPVAPQDWEPRVDDADLDADVTDLGSGAVPVPPWPEPLPLPGPDVAEAGPGDGAPEHPAAAADEAGSTAVVDPPDEMPAPDPVPEVAMPAAVVQPTCWQAGPFNEEQAQHLQEAAAAALPGGSWQLQRTSDQAPRWMIYLGDMEDELALLAKRSELHARGLDVDRAGAGFEPGLSLGRYSSREAADRALRMLSAEAGVSGARVVQERTETATYFLRAESTAADGQDQLRTLPLAGRQLRRCS